MSEIVKKDYLQKQIDKYHKNVISSKYSKNSSSVTPTVNFNDDYLSKVQSISSEVSNKTSIENSLNNITTNANNKYIALINSTEEPQKYYKLQIETGVHAFINDNYKLGNIPYSEMQTFLQSKIGGIPNNQSNLYEFGTSPIDDRVYIDNIGRISIKDNPNLTELQNDTHYYCIGKIIDDARNVIISNKLYKMYRDIHLIPDKYNCGSSATGNVNVDYDGELDIATDKYRNYRTKVYMENKSDYILESGQVDYMEVWCDESRKLFYIDPTTLLPYDCTLKISNTDFSGYGMSFYDSSGLAAYKNSNSKVTVIFENCIIPHPVAGTLYVRIIYNNCNHKAFAGEYSEFNNCYVPAGSNGDCCDAFSEIFLNNCYITNLLPTGGLGSHIDGVQVFGYGNTSRKTYHMKNAENIVVDNCRFELHVMYDSKWCEASNYGNGSSYVNASLFIKADFGNSDKILFKDVTSNDMAGPVRVCDGGSPTFYRRQRNVCLKGIKSMSPMFQQRTLDHFQNDITRVHNQERNQHLLVTSIWEDDTNINFSVSNDNYNDKTLTVVTNVGTYTIDVPRCPSFEECIGKTINDTAWQGKTFSDLPFDIKYSFPKTYGVEYMAFYDGLKRVRYINFTENDEFDDINPYDIYSSRTQAPSNNTIEPRPNIFYDLGDVSNSLNINFIIPTTGMRETDVWYMKFVAKSTNINMTTTANDFKNTQQTYISVRRPASFVIGKTYEITMSDYKMCIS